MQKILIILGFLLLSLNTGAQKDTISHVNEIEDPHYKLYVEDQKKEINRLFKINMVGMGAFILNCALEVKISKSLTSETYVKLGKEVQYSIDTSSRGFVRSIGMSDVVEIENNIKYYYNFKRREKLDKITNGFCGNYIAIRLFGSERSYTDYSQPFDTYGVGINYGLQRRVGNIGFVEIFAGIRYQFREIPEKYEDIIINGVNYPSHDVKKSTLQELLPTIGLRAGFDLAPRKRR